jgi:hypothetical protein
MSVLMWSKLILHNDWRRPTVIGDLQCADSDSAHLQSTLGVSTTPYLASVMCN